MLDHIDFDAPGGNAEGIFFFVNRSAHPCVMDGYPTATESGEPNVLTPPMTAEPLPGEPEPVTLAANGGRAQFRLTFGSCAENHMNRLTSLVVGPPGLPPGLDAPTRTPDGRPIDYCWVQQFSASPVAAP